MGTFSPKGEGPKQPRNKFLNKNIIRITEIETLQNGFVKNYQKLFSHYAVVWYIWFRSFYNNKNKYLIHEGKKSLCTKKQKLKAIFRTLTFRLFRNTTLVLVLPEDIDELNLQITSLNDPTETKANRQLTNFLNNYKDTVYKKENTCYLPLNQVTEVEKKVKWISDNEVFSTESRFITKSNRLYKNWIIFPWTKWKKKEIL